MSTRRRMKSKNKIKSRSSRGGGLWYRVKGLFGPPTQSNPAPNQEPNQAPPNQAPPNQAPPNQEPTQEQKQEPIQEQKQEQKGSFFSIWPFNKLSKAPPVPPGPVQIPGRPPMQQQQQPSPGSSSVQGGRRRRRRRTCKKRK